MGGRWTRRASATQVGIQNAYGMMFNSCTAHERATNAGEEYVEMGVDG